MKKALLRIFGILLIICSVSQNAYATNVSSSDIKSYQTVVNENQFFISMISEIFSTDDEIDNVNKDVKYFNTETIIDRLTTVAIDALKSWGDSSIYFLFLGIGLFILFAKTIGNMIENEYGQEKKTLEQYFRMGTSLVISMVIILNINNILIGFLTLFRYIYLMTFSYIKESELGTNGAIVFTDAEKIAYNILKGVGADSNSIVDQALNTNGQSMMLIIQYFVLWLICIAGKIVLIIALTITSLEILANGMMYPIAAGDIGGNNLKGSSFLSYTKKIISAIFRILIMIIAMLGAKILLSDFTGELLDSASKVYEGVGATRAKSNEIFNIALMLSAMQASKCVLATILSWQISKKLVGED